MIDPGVSSFLEMYKNVINVLNLLQKESAKRTWKGEEEGGEDTRTIF